MAEPPFLVHEKADIFRGLTAAASLKPVRIHAVEKRGRVGIFRGIIVLVFCAAQFGLMLAARSSAQPRHDLVRYLKVGKHVLYVVAVLQRFEQLEKRIGGRAVDRGQHLGLPDELGRGRCPEGLRRCRPGKQHRHAGERCS